MCNLVHVYLGSVVSRHCYRMARTGILHSAENVRYIPVYTLHLLSREPTANEAYLIRLC